LTPATGLNESKVAVTMIINVFFQDKYPKMAPAFKIVDSKGLDDD
jgi:hypothetical protein